MHNVETITASGLLNLLKNAYFGLFIFKMKKRSEATQTLRAALAVVRRIHKLTHEQTGAITIHCAV